MPAAGAPRPRGTLFVFLVIASSATAVLGFAREALIGALFGASRSSDALYAALTLPFIAAYFLVGGALAPPLTAALARHLERGEGDAARRLLGRALLVVGVAGGFAAGAVLIASHPIARLLVPGFDAAGLALTARLLRIAVLYGVLTSAGQLFSAALVAAGAYRTPAVAILLGNLTALAVLVAGPRDVETAAWAMSASGAVYALALLPPLLGSGLAPRRGGAALRLPWRDAGFLALSLAAAAAVDLAERPFASVAGVGVIALLTFASKLIHLPMRLVAAPLASVAFPRFVRGLGRRDRATHAEAGETAGWILQLLLCAAGVAAAGAGPIAAVTFGRGRFDAQAVASLASALAVLAPAIVAIGVVEFASKYLLASDSARSVALAQLLGLAVYLAAAPLLARRGLVGLALARDLSWCVAATGLLVALARREKGLSLLRSGAWAAVGGAIAALLAAPAARLHGGGAVRAGALALAGVVAFGAIFAAQLVTGRRGRLAPAELADAPVRADGDGAAGGRR